MNKRIVATEKAPKAIGPYSQAVVCGNFIYTSGQLGINPSNGELVPDLEGQTKQALENIKAILEKSGSNLEGIIKTTVFLYDMHDFATVNKIYEEFMEEPYPARSAVQVAKLPLQGLIEVEAIAEIAKLD